MKTTVSLHKHPTKQAATVILGSYLSYAFSEAMGYTGVLSVFFCGKHISNPAAARPWRQPLV